MSDFAGKEFDFAAGSIKGLRSWNMDPMGRLHGVTHKQVWTPGENLAECKGTREIPCPALVKAEAAKPKSLSEDAIAAPKSQPKKWRRHKDDSLTTEFTFYAEDRPWLTDPYAKDRLSRCGEKTCYRGVHTVRNTHEFDPSCQCGFWAYDESGFAVQGKVVGVVEGYGKATIGTKGFRVQKARIIALAKSAADDKTLTMSEQVRLAQLYPEVEFFENVAELVEAHPETLRDWPAVGDDFWTTPVPEDPNDSWAYMRNSLLSSYVSMTSPSRMFGRGVA